MKIFFLGTGANSGTPQLDCKCQNCQSGIKRKRSCVLVESEKGRVLLDCGPDINSQLQSVNLKWQDISGIALSHLHWDHCQGLVELSCGQKLEMPIIVPEKLKIKLEKSDVFSFLFQFGFARFVDQLRSYKISFFSVKHSDGFPTYAIKIAKGEKSLLYAPDIAKIDEELLAEISKVDCAIIDGTFINKRNKTHVPIEESVKLLSNVNKSIIFSHINHSECVTNIQTIIKRYGFEVAYDSMSLEI